MRILAVIARATPMVSLDLPDFVSVPKNITQRIKVAKAGNMQPRRASGK